MIKKIISVLFLFTCLFLLSLPLQARELSKSAQIYKEVKGGVVTIFTSAGHGSGFLIDDTGLILTNSHVVNEAGSDIRVSFGKDLVLQGDILIHDRKNDLAILYVNLEKIKNYKTLKCYIPNNKEALVLVGEKILAIGSPIQRESLEKTLTEGIISKYDNEIINHDATINPGNSGGPLLNFDGNVVGLNTFSYVLSKGPGISGAVPIYKVLDVYSTVKDNLANYVKPSSNLLPDIPRTTYPYNDLLKKDEKFFKEYKKRDYVFKNKHYIVGIQTPSIKMSQLKTLENTLLKRRKKRAKKKGFQVSEDEYYSKTLFKYYNYEKPVVSVNIMAIPKLTKGSQAKKAIAFLGAATVTTFTLGLAAPTLATPLVVGNKKEFKKDFYEMKITDSNDEKFIPYSTGRLPVVTEAGCIFGIKHLKMVNDKSYMGIYEYDPEDFLTDEPLKIIVKGEGIKEKENIIKIPDKIKEYIRKDFQVYWDMLAEDKKLDKKQVYETETEVLAEIVDKNADEDKINTIAQEQEPGDTKLPCNEDKEISVAVHKDQKLNDQKQSEEDVAKKSDIDSIIADLEMKTFNEISQNIPLEERLSLLELHFFSKQLSNLSNGSRIKAIQNKLNLIKKE